MSPNELKARFPHASQSTILRNLGGQGAVTAGPISGQPEGVNVTDAPRPNFTPRPTTREERLNKLEKARLAYLRAQGRAGLRIQAITLLLAEDCRYTADFSYVDDTGRMVFEDTKGPQVWEDSIIKLKTAARMFPEFRFVIVKREGAQWLQHEVKP